MKKGFTLIELMAVIIIISLLAILTFPNIVGQIKKSKNAKNNNVNAIVISAAKRYINDNQNEYDKEWAVDYCVAIKDLVDNDYLKEELVNDEENNLLDYVVNVIKEEEIDYEIANECVMPYIKEGLILYLDGINNTRKGPNSNTAIWEDLSGNKNDRQLINFDGEYWGSNSLKFDGIDDYLNDIEITGTNGFTYQIVLKHDTTNIYRNIYEKKLPGSKFGQNPMLWIDPKSKLEFNATYGLNGITPDCSEKISSLTTTVNSNNSFLYINNQKVNYTYVRVSDTDGTYQMFNRLGSQFYKGEVYSVRIYNRELTEKELKHNYETDKKRFNVE